jgi:hypothetical protein
MILGPMSGTQEAEVRAWASEMTGVGELLGRRFALTAVLGEGD